MNKKFITIVSTTLFSLILWGFITLSDEFFTSYSVHVKFTNIPEGYAVGVASERTVVLNLKSEGWQLAKIIYGADFDLEIPVKEKPGKQTLSVLDAIPGNSWLSSKIAVNGVKPELIEIKLEKIIYKKVKIKPDIKIELKPGYQIISGIELLPDTVTIFGPKSVVRSLDTVATAEVLLEEADSEISEVVALKPIPSIEFRNGTTNLYVDIQKIVDKTVGNVKVEIRNLRKGYDLILMPDKLEVSVRGGMKLLSELSGNSIRATVDFVEALNDSTGTIIPKVTYPANVQLLNIKPQKLEYIIKQF